MIQRGYRESPNTLSPLFYFVSLPLKYPPCNILDSRVYLSHVRKDDSFCTTTTTTSHHYLGSVSSLQDVHPPPYQAFIREVLWCSL